MIPASVVEYIEDQVGHEIAQSKALGGGCIAHATRIETADGPFFLKYGTGDVARTFGPEADGLRALREAASSLTIPEVLAVSEDVGDGTGMLLAEWIDEGREQPGFWEDFGRGLAEMHRETETRYGFGRDNYIGRLPQENGWEETWTDFFRRRRLEPQVRRAKQNGRWSSEWDRSFDRLCDRLGELLPESPPPSMLHGDLWGGNFMIAETGAAALFDPAAYYGHREADLAMTELFGGFSPAFYAAYREAWPLEGGYDVRKDVYNLYHLINHLNHFGGSYAGQVASVLRRFG